MFKRIKQALILFLSHSFLLVQAQAPALSLEKCQELAKANYPLIRQHGLIAKGRDYSIANAGKGYLPQFSIAGQATYQSAITTLPIEAPGIDFPSLKKDQYKIYAELDQKLFDGGAIRQQKESQEASAEVQQQSLEVDLYSLKEQVNQLFFGILTIAEQLKQNDLLQQDISLGLQKVRKAIYLGTALKSEADVLQAELLNTRQHSTELITSQDAYCHMLSLYIHESVTSDTRLDKPTAPAVNDRIRRPELNMYESRLKSLDITEKGLKIRNIPKFDLFFQGGYGRPALNILSPDFDAYYLGGIRVSWNFAGLYTQRNERSLLQLNRQQIGLEKEAFLFSTQLRMTEQQAGIVRYQQLLHSDDEIIGLRERVKTAAMAKLENGVINSNDYLRDVHAEDKARIDKILHEIQLLAALYSYQTLSGN